MSSLTIPEAVAPPAAPASTQYTENGMTFASKADAIRYRYGGGPGPVSGAPAAPAAVSSPFTIARASTLNKQSSLAEIRATVAGDGAALPMAYGRCQLGGKVFALDYSGGVWTVGVAFCLGEIGGFERLLISGEPPVTGVLVDYYTGTTSQTANSKLAAKLSGYADTLVYATPSGSVGVAYAVVQYAPSLYESWPTFVAEVRGKKVWNPATGTTIYSENPALHLGDLLRSSVYGGAWTVDDTDLEAVMDACDATVSGEVRRQCGVVVDSVQDTEQWVEILRAYASCFVIRRGGTVHLIPDAAASPVQAFTAADVVEGSLRITKQDPSNLPTVVRLKYTDTSDAQWRERAVIVKRAGVDAGTVPWRESVVSMIGVNRYSQAVREATERLNKLWLSDITVEWESFDEALRREAGDVVSMTHYLGLAAKSLRLVEEPVQVRPGRWRLRGVEYDAAVYSDSVENAPSSADGNLPASGPPAAPSSVTLTEQNYQTRNGEYASRIRVTWPASSDLFVVGYQVTVRQGGVVVYSAQTSDTEISTPAVQELLLYQVDVAAVTPLYVGATASGTLTITGKYAVPDGPPSVSGYEVASEVRLAWPADTSDYDIRRYEIRYGTTGGSWATATVLDRVDALTYVTRAIPEGTWRFYVDSIDSVGQYGTTPAYTDIEVSLNDKAYLAGSHACATASTTLMHAADESRTDDIITYYSDGGDTWTSLFGAAAMSTFVNPLASYQSAAGTSEWLSDVFDMGVSYTGDWLAVCAVTNFSGTATVQLGLSTDGSSYTYGALSQKGTARYARIRVQSSGIFSVRVPGPTIELRVVAREITGTGTSSASGVVTVNIGQACGAIPYAVAIPDSDADYRAAVSNKVTGASPTFDVSIRNAAGSRVAVNFSWAARIL